MGQANTKPTEKRLSSLPASPKNVFRPRKLVTRIELVSLQYVFNDLKSTFKDNFECIEPKKFLDYLQLPCQVEPAGVLLFKAFSYLGSYPSCTTAGPVPLSFDAFLTAFVVIVGYLDTATERVSENLFFQSLSVLPPPEDTNTAQTEVNEQNEGGEEELVIVTKSSLNQESKGLSLAELGVDFNDVELDQGEEAAVSEEGTKILCRDLIELFVLLLWLGEADKECKHDFEGLRTMATSIVNNIKPLDMLSNSDDLPCISYASFCRWKRTFSPHLFKPLQSLVTKTFAYYEKSNQTRLLPKDQTPTPCETEILSPLYTTLLSWSLPEEILITKQWTRLYSADKDGFSMNRFESHVFKYPGPTLFVMRVDAVSTPHAIGSRKHSVEQQQHRSMVIGAYITQPWKNSKHFWGTNQCFLFELDPSFDIFHPIINQKGVENNDHYIYYHHEFGIGFGSTTGSSQTRQFIISLKNTLQEGTYQNEAYPSQPSFESAIISRKHQDFYYQFDTEDIEVFGLGNEKDREKQAKEWQFDKQEAARRAGLNLRQSDGQLDKELLKMAGIIDEDKRQDR
ncbi:TLD-domain-containing protein [Parasitella parasitica]|nr:TLD-domain-containing protein [Parasitella parasitica]